MYRRVLLLHNLQFSEPGLGRLVSQFLSRPIKGVYFMYIIIALGLHRYEGMLDELGSPSYNSCLTLWLQFADKSA